MASILVTGANRGIGLEFVRQLLARGRRVVATARQPGRATQLNHLCGDYPGHLHVLPLDLQRDDSIRELERELQLLDERLELLINSAGMLVPGERFGSVAATTLSDTLRCNAVAPFLLTQTLAPRLVDGAKVANISSQLGSIARVSRFGSVSYAISKAALNMATAQLAEALRPRGIPVVALHPGWVRTDMGGAGAEIDVDESVRGLLAVIDGLSMTATGAFLDWTGHTLPW